MAAYKHSAQQIESKQDILNLNGSKAGQIGGGVGSKQRQSPPRSFKSKTELLRYEDCLTVLMAPNPQYVKRGNCRVLSARAYLQLLISKTSNSKSQLFEPLGLLSTIFVCSVRSVRFQSLFLDNSTRMLGHPRCT